MAGTLCDAREESPARTLSLNGRYWCLGLREDAGCGLADGLHEYVQKYN